MVNARHAPTTSRFLMTTGLVLLLNALVTHILLLKVIAYHAKTTPELIPTKENVFPHHA